MTSTTARRAFLTSPNRIRAANLVLLFMLPFSGCGCPPAGGPDAGSPTPTLDAGTTNTDAGPCVSGELGCECLATATCNDALVCENEVCVEPAQTGLVFPADAAGCEVLLNETAGRLRVDFGDTTSGTFIREAPLTAVTLVVRGGQSGPLSATVAGGTFSVQSSRCVDAAGAEIAGTVAR